MRFTFFIILFLLFSNHIFAQTQFDRIGTDPVKVIIPEDTPNDTIVSYHWNGSIKKATIKYSSINRFYIAYRFNRKGRLVKLKSQSYINSRMGSCGELTIKKKYVFSKKTTQFKSRYNSEFAYKCYFGDGTLLNINQIEFDSINLKRILKSKKSK